MELRGITGAGVGGQKLGGNGVVSISMGLVWREVHILAQRAATPNKWFFSFITVQVLLSILCEINMLPCAIIIFLLCRLKIKHVMEIQNMRLFLDLLAWLQTVLFLAQLFITVLFLTQLFLLYSSSPNNSSLFSFSKITTYSTILHPTLLTQPLLIHLFLANSSLVNSSSTNNCSFNSSKMNYFSPNNSLLDCT
jgi:hypothetical protein